VSSLGESSFKQGNLCHVTGLFILEKTIAAHTLARGVEVEKVEKVSNAADKTAGQVCRKTQGPGMGPGGKYLRGFFSHTNDYIP
jgi:hypothetical protein